MCECVFMCVCASVPLRKALAKAQSNEQSNVACPGFRVGSGSLGHLTISHVFFHPKFKFKKTCAMRLAPSRHHHRRAVAPSHRPCLPLGLHIYTQHLWLLPPPPAIAKTCSIPRKGDAASCFLCLFRSTNLRFIPHFLFCPFLSQCSC